MHCERVKVGQCNAQLCTYMHSVLGGLWFVASVIVLKMFVYSQFYSFSFFSFAWFEFACVFAIVVCSCVGSGGGCVLMGAWVWVMEEGVC